MAEALEGLLLVGGHVAIPAVIIVVVVAATTLALGRIMNSLRLADIPALLAFCLLGLVVGLFTGNSKSPVVASLLPALVTFISGLVAYLAAKDTLQVWRKQIPLLLVGFLATTALSTFYGSFLRGKDQERENEAKKQMLFYERVRLEYEKAQLLKTLEPKDAKGPAPTATPPKPK